MAAAIMHSLSPAPSSDPEKKIVVETTMITGPLWENLVEPDLEATVKGDRCHDLHDLRDLSHNADESFANIRVCVHVRMCAS
jgi:hypothetical protein